MQEILEQLTVTSMSVVLTAAYSGGLPPIAVAGMLLAICCAGLTQWLMLSHGEWAWLPSACLGLMVLAVPSLFVALPAVGYAAARTFQSDRHIPPSAPACTMKPPYRVFAWCAALSWVPACIRLSLRALLGIQANSAMVPGHAAAPVCALVLLCIIAFMLGTGRRGLVNLAGAWRHAYDERRATARDLADRLSSSAEERSIAVRMATLNERTRIARDIHDNVGHLLTRAIMQTEASKVVAQARGETDAAQALSDIGITLQEAMSMMRRSVHDLADDGTDFATMIEDATQCPSTLKVQVTNGIANAPAPVARCCCALIREALANTVHHSHASHAEVTLRDFPAFWQIVVQDDGGNDSGMPGERRSYEHKRGMGLADIEDRVHALNGTCAFGPHESGWRVFASIPKAGFTLPSALRA